MRIVLDLQGAQASNAKRGIGRYSLMLAQAIARQRQSNELLVALNGLFPDSIQPIRAIFDGLITHKDIRVWQVPGPVSDLDQRNVGRRLAAEHVREAFLSSLRPDVILVSSLFEGLGDDAVTSIGAFATHFPIAVTLYDLIPYIYRKPYLESPAIESWYFKKIDHLRRANLLLAISESSRQEGIKYLGFPEDNIINISTDADPHFQRLTITDTQERALREKYGLKRPFLMYTGGIDHRKNIEGLIRAFARLPQALRETHQLAVVCSAQPESRIVLEQLAHRQGLKKDDFILTGFVPEDDLVLLYNLCKLFVFSSWHEGFGLPALEAMRCGSPVIGSDTSSLPEVIGRADALFDPHSDEAIASKIIQVLSNENFRLELIQHGQEQAKNFSWEKTAKRAISAFEELHEKLAFNKKKFNRTSRRPKLAYISPIPPERSGISDYSAELLPELARHYEIDAVVAQASVNDAWINAVVPIRSVEWFRSNADRFERVLYHFGNSHFHQHMVSLLEEIPGVVVLHDFFLSGLISHMDFHNQNSNIWAKELYYSHSYKALVDFFSKNNKDEVALDFPCNLKILQNALGIIVHSEYSRKLADGWYGKGTADCWTIVPLLRSFSHLVDREAARIQLGINRENFLVCSFGYLNPVKLNHRLLDSWLASDLASDPKCHLFFVGENHKGEYGVDIVKAINRSGLGKRIHITGWTETENYKLYLAAADVGVQLRTRSRGETSAAVLDCMNNGLATIVNANGSLGDLPSDAVWKIPDDFFDTQLIDALNSFWRDRACLKKYGEIAREIIVNQHAPRKCADRYFDAIEHMHEIALSDIKHLARSLANFDVLVPDTQMFSQLAFSIERSIPLSPSQPQLLVDISGIIHNADNSDIKRACCSIIKEWLLDPPEERRIEPVYATPGESYQYARKFTSQFLGCPDQILVDEPIDLKYGDIFLCFDPRPEFLTKYSFFYKKIRQFGIKVYFVLFENLIASSGFYIANSLDFNSYKPYLNVILNSDGIVFTSKTNADNFSELLGKYGSRSDHRFDMSWFYIGVSVQSRGFSLEELPASYRPILKIINSKPSFLMVGSIEQSSGHIQVLMAFEQLWSEGQDINLVIVGNQGRIKNKIDNKFCCHPERDKRMFVFENFPEDNLDNIYSVCICLIAANEIEAMGLSIINAAYCKLPIIARDIPIFRELADGGAYYFSGLSASELAGAIQSWLSLYANNKHPVPDKIPYLTRKESALKLKQILTNNKCN